MGPPLVCRATTGDARSLRSGPGDEERPGAERTGRRTGRLRDALGPRHVRRTVHLRGSPGTPGPSIARGRATTSGLGGNSSKSTRPRTPNGAAPGGATPFGAYQVLPQAEASSTSRLRVRFGSTG